MVTLTNTLFSQILLLACLAYTISVFEPFRNLKVVLGFYTKFKNNLLFSLFNKITDCNKCLAFWLSITYFILMDYKIYNVVLLSSLTSLISELIGLIINKLR